MGSGVIPLAMTTRPRKDQGRRTEDGRQKSVFKRGLSLRATGMFIRRPSSDVRRLNTIKPIERLVPVGWSVAALIPPAYRRDGLSRLLGETWF
jgi:ribosomal protein S12